MNWLITGGAGFIGCNLARRLLADGHRVVVFDDLSRPGSEDNLAWLRATGAVEWVRGDVRDFGQVASALEDHGAMEVVAHLAAQVAVTTSIRDPRHDFEVNALGTFNVCEAVRRCCPSAVLLNASTNKVYGAMSEVEVVESGGRYRYRDLEWGVPETQPLDFHSPYACSKGSGEQYVRDYSRIYGLRTVNFRQSCIYGPRQAGIEDQSWVAWFMIATRLGRPLTIYGDGKQVRDVLFVDDLVECYLRAVERIQRANGQTYNIGGGPRNTVSLLELVEFLEGVFGRKAVVSFAGWRPGDQRVFVCDTRKAAEDLDWRPRTAKADGFSRLAERIASHGA